MPNIDVLKAVARVERAAVHLQNRAPVTSDSRLLAASLVQLCQIVAAITPADATVPEEHLRKPGVIPAHAEIHAEAEGA